MAVLSPIPTSNLTPADVEDLARQTRERMLEELVLLTEKTRRGASLGTGTNGARPVVGSPAQKQIDGLGIGRSNEDGQTSPGL